jgi:hypothetical protein
MWIVATGGASSRQTVFAQLQKMAHVFLARISSTLSSYSNRVPGMHRVVYTQDEVDVPIYVTQAVHNKDPRGNGPEFSAAKQKEHSVYSSAGPSSRAS